jgi:iron(III) transport system substrate-binding protein
MPSVHKMLLYGLTTIALAGTIASGDLLAQSKPESEVVFYVSANITTGQAIANAFKAKHPGIAVKLYRTSGENMVNKVATEKRAGRILFDVIYGAAVPFLPRLGVLQPYQSPQFKFYDPKYRNPKSLWAGASLNYYVISYNTKLVPPAEVPKDWSDLTDKKWRKSIAMDPEEYTWLAGMEAYLGVEKAAKLLTALGHQDIQWRKGHSNIGNLLGAGEFKVALSYASSIEEAKGKGAPVEWVQTSRPIVVDTQGVGLSVRPAHPVAARMLYDFILSVDGQKAILGDHKTPIRGDVIPVNSPLRPDKLVLFPPPHAVYENLKVYAKKFDKYFGPRR